MIYIFANEGYGQPFIAQARRLAQQGTFGEIVIIFSRKDRTRSCTNRWRKARRSLKEWLRLLWRRWWWKMPIASVPDVNVRAFLGRIQPGDYGIICGFDQIFREPLIRRFGGLINFHPSLLPYYRGPVPAYWCLLNGEHATGFTVHRVTAHIDRGEILHQEVVQIRPGDSAKTLTARIGAAGAMTLEHCLHHLRLENSPWPRQTVDAGTVYETHVDYASFPDRDATLKMLAGTPNRKTG